MSTDLADTELDETGPIDHLAAGGRTLVQAILAARDAGETADIAA